MSRPRTFSYQRGFSLVELMIAMTVGLLLLTGLSMIFVNTSNSNRELQRSSQQIENGRYAIDLLQEDIRLAGFYGHFYAVPSAPATLPDPCETASTTNMYNALGLSVQGYRAASLSAAPDISASTCDDKGLLTSANLKAGSDIIVVRRAQTTALAATDTAVNNDVYVQATTLQAEIQLGNGATIGTNKANGSASTLFLANGTTPAPIRKFRTHIYFVAPCSSGTGTGGVCQAGDDTIPTLKRLELGAGPAFSIVPLAEGIEYLKIEYGVDTMPSTANTATGLIGDSTIDSYTATPADWTTAIGAKIYILSRNTERSAEYKDDKTYTLGSVAVPAFNDQYKRHVFTTEIRMTNPAGRREIP